MGAHDPGRERRWEDAADRGTAATAPVSTPPGCALAALVGESAGMRRLRERVARLLPTSLPVLIQGETGTGKELLARALHEDGPRRARPFVPVNCGALAAELVESELFGHERGAFTGAVTRRPGRAAEAHGGTLFLDEIGELAPALQCKLLRLLQQGELQRVGADRPLAVDVRVVAATNRELRALVERGAFRADCYYRLSAFTVRLPPLRERAGDVLLLADRLLAGCARELGRAVPVLDAGARVVLARHHWPGNVRELENVLRACVLYSDRPAIGAAEVRGAIDEGTGTPATAAAAPPPDLAELLGRCAGNVSRAARELGVSRPTFYKRMRERGLAGSAYRGAAVRPSGGALEDGPTTACCCTVPRSPARSM